MLSALIAAASICVDAFPQSLAAAPLPLVLQRAGEYVVAYERGLSLIVADEDYTQRYNRATGIPQEFRRLRSDLLTVRDDAGRWVGFRDVYEIDGRPVRDRNDRLTKLFLQSNADSRSQAERLAAESARFNLAPAISRTINLPLLVLQFLRPANQQRSDFALSGTKTLNGHSTTVLRFQERLRPRLIQTNDDAPATGRFWVEPDTGRIVETELFVSTSKRPYNVAAVIHVTYGEDSRVGAWVPLSMTETYTTNIGMLDGHAVYSKFRKFGVTTDEIVKAP